MANRSTYVRIVNNTRWTISGDYKHTHGHTAGALPGEIPPHSMSNLLEASQTNALIGAAGRYFLKVGLDTEDPEDATIQFSEACPVSSANEFHLEKVSPFAVVRARFGLGKPTGAPDWGAVDLPEIGHPFGIQLTIDEQPVPERLSMLTYNTHLFDGSNAEVGGDLKGVTIVFRDTARMQELVKRIATLPAVPDVVCLQEVWALKMQHALAHELAAIYPYVYAVPDIGFRGMFHEIRNAVTNTSGLMVASRFFLRNIDFDMYTGASKKWEDGLAKKGALAFRIRVPMNDRQAFDVAVGTTHAFTPHAEAEVNVEHLAQITLDGQQPPAKHVDGVLLGDFNIHHKQSDEIETLSNAMAKWGAEELVDKFAPGEYTDWPTGVKLTGILDHKEPTYDVTRRDRIDYVFFRPGDESHLRPDGAAVFHDWVIDDGVEVSDHCPVMVSFEVTA